MYTKEQLNDLYERIIKAIDITDELFEAAEKEYIDMGNWIDEKTPEYKISIYPQGSFALGTVIKPFDDRDDYDLDLVCEFEQQYALSAESLKCDVVKPLLSEYRKIDGEIEEKRRCWHVEYENVPNFHMDIIPAVYRERYIDITDHDKKTNSYEYIGSNPKGYIKWFNDKKALQRKILFEKQVSEMSHSLTCQADIDELKEYKLKTPLQKSIQLLKRHRDIMFMNDTQNLKPISIIITTIAAEVYNNEDNIVDALNGILCNAENYIKAHMNKNEFHVDNPSYTGGETENFAEKWNIYPERAEAFKKWIQEARKDLVSEAIYENTRLQMAENIKKSFGENTCKKIYDTIAEEERVALKEKKTQLNPVLGVLASSGSIPVPPNRHYGK